MEGESNVTVNNATEETNDISMCLFSAIKENIPPKEKIKKIIKYLDMGADLDKIDVTNNCNTPLHVAAYEGEVQIVEFLLDKGANVSIKNNNNFTILDIPYLKDIPNVKQLTTAIESRYSFQKRSGTSGISGHLYETKLLSLILFRILHDNYIKNFVLGTNVSGAGDFDDIILRYKTIDSNKDKIIFLQAKHRDGENLTIEDVLNPNGDFSLQKYLISYVEIRRKFVTDIKNSLFRGLIKNIDCKFIIYTSAKQYFTRKGILVDVTSTQESFIKTSRHGKVFKFNDENEFANFPDLDSAVSSFTESRTITLAKTLSKFILEDNYKNMLLNDLIITYRLFLLQNVIIITEKLVDHYIAKFRPEFWTSDNPDLMLLRHEICKNIVSKEPRSTHDQKAQEVKIQTRPIKLPLDFDNNYFQFTGDTSKRKSRVEHMCSIFRKLLPAECNKDLEYITITLDDDSVGTGELIQSSDLGKYWLGGLVGNLFINDDETDMLKFNFDKQTLSEDNINILERLRELYGSQLSIYRFDVNFYRFPKLKLNTKNCIKYDRKVVIDLLSKLRICTNQAKEVEVENILKKEIDKNLQVRHKQQDALFRVKNDAIYLNVHDQITNWWKQPNSASYLTKACNWYLEAEQKILDSSLLNIIHSNCTKKIKRTQVQFEKEAIDILMLDKFFKSKNDKIIIISSDEIYFTSIKIFQYFEIPKDENFTFIDLECEIIEDYMDIMENELESCVIPTLVLIARGCLYDFDTLYETIDVIKELFYKNNPKGKMIIIVHNNFVDILKAKYSTASFCEDHKNSFKSLSTKIRKMILEERKITFQGVEVNINTVLDDASLDLLSPNLLRQIIDNKKNENLGEALTSPSYEKAVNYFVNRSLSRYITLDNGKENNHEFCIVTDSAEIDLAPLRNDVILITESENDFHEVCRKRKKGNVHWFTVNQNHKTENEIKAIKKQSGDDMIWKQSQGSLEAILQYVDRKKTFLFQPKTLKDVEDKVVIVSAEPGMGKSILLTSLAINTKNIFRNLWIIKISLLDNVDQFTKWNKNKTDINLVEVFTFLYSIIRTKDFKNNRIRENVSKLISVHENNEIYLKNYESKYLPELDLSEIKLFNYFYNNGNVAILFDGFDEICPDFANEVIQLLCTLKTSKVAHLWVTTRSYNVLEQLEIALGIFSFSLNPLTQSEQKQYLLDVWTHRLGFDNLYIPESKSVFVRRVYSTIGSCLGDMEGNFMSFPLHLYMIAKIYESNLRGYIDKDSAIRRFGDDSMKDISNTSLNMIYEKFTTSKFIEIRFGEKKKSNSFNDPDMRIIMEDAQKEFAANHRRIAASMILDKNVLLTAYDKKKVEEFKEAIQSGKEKTGIIERIAGNSPQFIHYTFAEYFAVELIFDKLISDECTSSMWQYLLTYILISDKRGLRRFIDSKLQREQNIISILKVNKDHMNIVLDSLLSQCNTSYTTAIHTATSENFEYIITFLLECSKVVIGKDNLPEFIKLINKKCTFGRCVFCFAISKHKPTLVKCLINLITDVDYNKLKDLFSCADMLECSPFLSALHNQEISYLILRSLQHNPDLLVELFTLRHENKMVQPTSAHFIGTNSNAFSCCWDYLVGLGKENCIKIFSVKDYEGQLPIHYAAKAYHYDFFKALDQFLGREIFKSMCTTTDNSGYTPLCCFPYEKVFRLNELTDTDYYCNQEEEDLFVKELKNIVEKVYGISNEIDVIDFALYRLPKLYPKKHR